MQTSVDRRVILVRWARTLAVTVLGMLTAWLASPDGLALVGKDNAVYVLTIAVPTLAAVDKYLRERWGIKKAMAAARAAEAAKKPAKKK